MLITILVVASSIVIFNTFFAQVGGSTTSYETIHARNAAITAARRSKAALK